MPLAGLHKATWHTGSVQEFVLVVSQGSACIVLGQCMAEVVTAKLAINPKAGSVRNSTHQNTTREVSGRCTRWTCADR